MVKLRALWKAPGYLLLLIGIPVVAAARRLLTAHPHESRQVSIHTASRFSQWILRWLGVRVNVSGLENLPKDPCFIVVNHVSDLDTLILSALIPVVFITSIEVRESVFQGLIARMAGSTFVERRSQFNLLKELGETTRLLRVGFSTVLFPEATTSNGEEILPFRPAFFQAAINARSTLLPVCLRYTHIDGEPITSSNRDRVFYYGNMDFAAHLLRVCSTRSIQVECRILPPIPLSGKESRKALAQQVRNAILASYRPLIPAPRRDLQPA